MHTLMSVNDFQDILLKEKDERFRYLLKHGNLKEMEILYSVNYYKSQIFGFVIGDHLKEK